MAEALVMFYFLPEDVKTLAFIDDIHLKNERSMRKLHLITIGLRKTVRLCIKLKCVNYIVRIVDLIRDESGV
jgi:hypothetical protein